MNRLSLLARFHLPRYSVLLAFQISTIPPGLSCYSTSYQPPRD